jgi:hypothetical protein
MPETRRTIEASAEEIFQVLADGWLYASWVVGAAHMRDVDDTWPQPGARLHHRVGPWPLNVDDKTTVRTMVPNQLLELDAHVWPLGAAQVRLRLEPQGPGRTVVCMEEWLSSPLASRIPHAVQTLLIVPRNQESLARLGDLAIHRIGQR